MGIHQFAETKMRQYAFSRSSFSETKQSIRPIGRTFRRFRGACCPIHRDTSRNV